MKSKLMMLILAGGLAISASAPFAMARVSGTLPPTTKGGSVTFAKNAAPKAATRKFGNTYCGKQKDCRAIVGPHTVLPGATHNAY